MEAEGHLSAHLRGRWAEYFQFCQQGQQRKSQYVAHRQLTQRYGCRIEQERTGKGGGKAHLLVADEAAYQDAVTDHRRQGCQSLTFAPGCEKSCQQSGHRAEDQIQQPIRTEDIGQDEPNE